MILRYPFIRRNVTEHATLLLIVSAHVFLDAASPSPVTAPATFSAACKDRRYESSRTRGALSQFYLEAGDASDGASGVEAGAGASSGSGSASGVDDGGSGST